jgi:hypothetical protein
MGGFYQLLGLTQVERHPTSIAHPPGGRRKEVRRIFSTASSGYAYGRIWS